MIGPGVVPPFEEQQAAVSYGERRGRDQERERIARWHEAEAVVWIERAKTIVKAIGGTP